MRFPQLMMEKLNENLISIDELIARAKNLGVNFGKGNAKNRLRYFVKIGLFPHAQRKSYKGLPSQGVYPESALKILLEIDKKIKEGKSILQIKRELRKEREEKILKEEPIAIDETILSKERILFRKKVRAERKTFKPRFLSKVLFAILIFFIFSFLFAKEKINYKKPLDMFLATITNFKKVSQVSNLVETEEEFLPSTFLESFLTINAETLIKPKLTVEESIIAPNFVITRGGFSATFSPLPLTADRIYNFPDASGVVCLSTGNCFGLGGEVSSPGGTPNRLAKFTGLRKIENSSILDLFRGISITINELGNVGIGTPTPLQKLHVQGNIQSEGELFVFGNIRTGGEIRASGDICTELGGGICLSQVSLVTPTIVGARGIRGSGTIGYLPIWTGARSLGNSILFQADGKIAINTPVPNEILTLGGSVSLAKISEPTLTPGFGKIFVGIDGKLYYKDDSGNVYDLTTTGDVSGQGRSGQVVFWNSTSTISGSDEFFWDINSRKLGIGTNAPAEKLEVVGTIKMTGFQLTTGAQESYILTSDVFGFGTWKPAPTGTVPAGLFGQTLRHDGSGWVANDFLYNTGSSIGVGTTSAMATLAVAGTGFFSGPLTIETTNLSQLVLRYDSDNYLEFSITSTSSEIFTSKTLIFNSLTGEMKFFETSLKKGDKVLRSSFPIFKYPIAAETSSSTFISLTKMISPSDLNSVLPPQFSGSQRKFAFLINFADNIPETASSSWQVDFQNQSDIDFEFQGQNLSNLDEGVAHLKDDITGLLDDNWILKAKVPSQNYKLRVFNIFLLVYDQIQ